LSCTPGGDTDFDFTSVVIIPEIDGHPRQVDFGEKVSDGGVFGDAAGPDVEIVWGDISRYLVFVARKFGEFIASGIDPDFGITLSGICTHEEFLGDEVIKG